MVPLIEIRNLNHYYGKGTLKKQILFDIDLDIYPGEIILLTGPSGSGKTTLLSLIGGLRSVQDGSLRTAEIELRGAKEDVLVAVRRHTGYIFQAHNLLPFMTARQNVQMSVELHENVSADEANARSAAALEAVGLGQHTHYYPDKLSGGQKQRVAIARALVNRPKLILADEPTAALDSHTGREVVNLMQKMAREQNCTILLVTHDNRILDIADRIVHLEDGKLQKEAALQESVLVSSPHYASLKKQAIESPVVSERFVSPSIVASSERLARLHHEADRITPTPENKTEFFETQAPSFDPSESTHDLELQFKADAIKADGVKADALTVVAPAVAQWQEPIAPSELDRIVEAVIQEDFQMYVDLFSLADAAKAGETGADELAVVQWQELQTVEAKAEVPETTELAAIEPTVVQWNELQTIEARADAPKIAELVVAEPTVARWQERVATPELDQIVEAVTQEDFQMYVEWFSFRVANERRSTELYTIACIDDSTAILEVLKSFLSDELFSVVLISDPIKALTQLIRVKPNLIILDITMPGLNGYQLCELLRRHRHFKDLPVIFITGDRRMFNPKEAQKLGVKDCLIKPFNQSDLIVKLFPYLV